MVGRDPTKNTSNMAFLQGEFSMLVKFRLALVGVFAIVLWLASVSLTLAADPETPAAKTDKADSSAAPASAETKNDSAPAKEPAPAAKLKPEEGEKTLPRDGRTSR